MNRRVVITGLGIVAPNGIGKDKYWEAIKSGKSGVSKIDKFDTTNYPTKIAGQVRDFNPADFMEKKDARWMSRFTQLSLASARLAIEDSGLQIEKENSYRTGIAMGTAIGGLEIAEKE